MFSWKPFSRFLPARSNTKIVNFDWTVENRAFFTAINSLCGTLVSRVVRFDYSRCVQHRRSSRSEERSLFEPVRTRSSRFRVFRRCLFTDLHVGQPARHRLHSTGFGNRKRSRLRRVPCTDVVRPPLLRPRKRECPHLGSYRVQVHRVINAV